MGWNPFEMAASAVLNHPYTRAARDTIRFAGDKLRPILPEGTGVAIDTGENAIRAVTGDRSHVGQHHTLVKREMHLLMLWIMHKHEAVVVYSTKTIDQAAWIT